MTNHKKEYVFLGTLMSITTLSGLILSSPSSHADTSGTVTLTVDVPASCSLTVNPSTHTATINPGNTGLIGTSTIKSICNDPAGLAVYAVGYTGDTYGNTNLASTVGSNTINIATNVTPSGTPESSEWYMTLAAVSGDYTPTIATGYDSAHIIPNVYTKVAYRNTMTDMGTNATGANFTAQFNAYIAPTQAAGTYTGKVKFLLVHPNIINGSTTPTTEAPNTLPYDPEVTMQGWGGCAGLVSIGDTTTLVDTRDGTEYSVAKLADGKCWMTRNLRLNLSEANITDDNTNNPASGFAASAMITQPTNAGAGSSIYGGDSYEIRYSTDHIGSETVDYYGHALDDYGIYYNWYTATAGNGTSEVMMNNTNMAGDICPKNWHLPTKDEVNLLYDSIRAVVGNSSDAVGEMMRSATYNFVYGGRITWNYISYTGTDSGTRYGIYWTSTVGPSTNAHSLSLNPSSFAVLSWQRSQGSSVRCIASD